MVILLAIDGDNGGCWFKFGRRSIQICLWFVALRIFFCSEEELHSVIAIAKGMEKEKNENIRHYS